MFNCEISEKIQNFALNANLYWLFFFCLEAWLTTKYDNVEGWVWKDILKSTAGVVHENQAG